MVLSAGDLAFRFGEENLELCRVVNVHRDEQSENVTYDMIYCCEFTNKDDPKSIVNYNRGSRRAVPSYRTQVPGKEFVYSYMQTISKVKSDDLKYSIRGNFV